MKQIKSFLLCALVMMCFNSFSQSNETTIEVRLYLPAHVKNTLTTADKLTVYFTTFPDDTLKMPKKTVAKKIKENIYQFQMPITKFWHVGFSIGNYSYQMVCVNNKDGGANETYDFNILLENKKVDFTKPLMLPPCIRSDDEE